MTTPDKELRYKERLLIEALEETIKEKRNVINLLKKIRAHSHEHINQINVLISSMSENEVDIAKGLRQINEGIKMDRSVRHLVKKIFDVIDEKEEKIDLRDSKIEKLEYENSELKEEVEELKVKLYQEKKILKEKDKEIQSLESKIDSLGNEIHDLTKELNTSNDRVEYYVNEKARLEQKYLACDKELKKKSLKKLQQK